jgi:hypothetical protein
MHMVCSYLASLEASGLLPPFATQVRGCCLSDGNLLQVFYKCHIACFLGFLVFGMIHFWWNWVIFVPGEQQQPCRSHY